VTLRVQTTTESKIKDSKSAHFDTDRLDGKGLQYPTRLINIRPFVEEIM